MEHKKNGIENMKVWFGDFLDEINDSKSEMLNKVAALEKQLMLMQAEVVRYETIIDEMKKRQVELENRGVQINRAIAAMSETNAGAEDSPQEGEQLNPEPEMEIVAELEMEPEPGIEIEPEMEMEPEIVAEPESAIEPEAEAWPPEPIPDNPLQADSEPGFLLDEEAPGGLATEPEPIPAAQPEPGSAPRHCPALQPEPASVLQPKQVSVTQLEPASVSQPKQVHPPRGAAHRETEGIPDGDLFSQPERRIILEAARPDWYDWEVDYPASYLENIADGIGFNDRILFLKELFAEDDALFKQVVMRVNEMELFSEAVEYLRAEFPHWNEQSDEVYRFYMNVRRKLRK